MWAQLTLSIVGDSGQYRCQAYSIILDMMQQQQSSFQTVYILYFPMTGSVNAGVAVLVLDRLASQVHPVSIDHA